MVRNTLSRIEASFRRIDEKETRLRAALARQECALQKADGARESAAGEAGAAEQSGRRKSANQRGAHAPAAPAANGANGANGGESPPLSPAGHLPGTPGIHPEGNAGAVDNEVDYAHGFLVNNIASTTETFRRSVMEDIMQRCAYFKSPGVYPRPFPAEGAEGTRWAYSTVTELFGAEAMAGGVFYDHLCNALRDDAGTPLTAPPALLTGGGGASAFSDEPAAEAAAPHPPHPLPPPAAGAAETRCSRVAEAPQGDGARRVSGKTAKAAPPAQGEVGERRGPKAEAARRPGAAAAAPPPPPLQAPLEQLAARFKNPSAAARRRGLMLPEVAAGGGALRPKSAGAAAAERARLSRRAGFKRAPAGPAWSKTLFTGQPFVSGYNRYPRCEGGLWARQAQRVAEKRRGPKAEAADVPAPKTKAYYYLHVRVLHADFDPQKWRFNVRFVDVDAERELSLENLRASQTMYLVFSEPDNHLFSPVDSFPWVSDPEQLHQHTVRIEVFAVMPARTKVVDSYVYFADDGGDERKTNSSMSPAPPTSGTPDRE
ncbi:hypothetical protein DIPPA_07976 [Diplonema papillatum]|nr:hypothetical protein DIPPA_07976 [Diplonema papillatum]